MPRPPIFFALCAALALGSGCDSGKKEAADTGAKAEGGAATGKAEAGAATGKADGGAATGATGATGKAEGGDATTKVGNLTDEERAKLQADGKAARTAIQEGRDKGKAGDWAGAVQAFARAVALDDDNPHILAELGWAQFNNKDLAGAERNLRLALRYERDRKRRADALYKLGRVEEERGDYAAAKEHFDQSLALAEVAEAKQHADAISDKAAAACADGTCAKPDYVDLKAACEAMLARVHEQQGIEKGSANDEFKCDPAAAKIVEMSGGDATEAALLVVKGSHAGTDEEEHDLLVHIEGGWHWVGTLLDLENPHDGGIERTGSIKSFEAKELMPNSPGTEVLVQLEFLESDVDLDDNIVYHDEHEAYIVCGINKGVHVCHEVPTRMSWKAAALDPTLPVTHELSQHGFTASATFDGKGNVTVEGEGEIPEGEAGTHPISELPEPIGFVFLHEE